MLRGDRRAGSCPLGPPAEIPNALPGLRHLAPQQKYGSVLFFLFCAFSCLFVATLLVAFCKRLSYQLSAVSLEAGMHAPTRGLQCGYEEHA